MEPVAFYVISQKDLLEVLSKVSNGEATQAMPQHANKEHWQVKIVHVPRDKKIYAIKEVRRLLRCSLSVAKLIVEHAPIPLFYGKSEFEARVIADRLRSLGIEAEHYSR